MAKDSKKMQVVEDDEIENVGIMSGFMDDIDEFLGEIMEEEALAGEEDEMARVTGRTPDSPEILMNNLRGNMRSIDARREELAEMVGYNAAAETPDEVLAMLQPVLAQQDMAGIASILSPPSSGSPQALPEFLAPPAPAGGVPSLPMGQGPMPAPMPMKDGGIVQYFQEGGEGVSADSSYSAYPQEIVELAKARVMQMLEAPQATATPETLMERTTALTPQYEELLGVDKQAAKAQFLAALGQAALRYAGNVGPSGERLRGSGLARLAAGFSDVPAAAAKAASTIDAQQRQAKLAALQQAQSELSTAQALDKEERAAQLSLLQDISKQKTFRTLSAEELKSPRFAGLDPNRPWQIDSEGKLYAPGDGGTNISLNTTEGYTETLAKAFAEDDKTVIDKARQAQSNIRKIDKTIEQINTTENIGLASDFKLLLDRFRSQFLEDEAAGKRASDAQYLDALLGSEVFAQIGALGIGARGLDTPAERDFLIKVLTGDRSLTDEALFEMTMLRRDREIENIQLYNDRLAQGDFDIVTQDLGRNLQEIKIPEAPAFNKASNVPEDDASRRAAEEERERRRSGG